MKFKITFLLVVANLLHTLSVPLCICDRHMRPVCASNGITYMNRCTLECVSSTSPEVTYVRDGSCKNRGCVCDDDHIEVCGSNNVTYPSVCALSCAQIDDPQLIITSRGPCEVKWMIKLGLV